MKILYPFYFITLITSCAEADFDTIASAESTYEGSFLGTWTTSCITTNDFGVNRDVGFEVSFTDSGEYTETTTVYISSDGTCSGSVFLTAVESHKYWVSDPTNLPIPEGSVATITSLTQYNLTIDSYQLVMTATGVTANGTSLKSYEELNQLGYCDIINWEADIPQDLTEVNPCHSSSETNPSYSVFRIEEYVDGSPLGMAKSAEFTAASSRPKQAGIVNLTKSE